MEGCMLVSEIRSLRDLEKTLDLDCLVEYQDVDAATGIEFRDCVIDHTSCPNQKCIKKLM
jgi:hypothetical protein